MLRRFAVFAVLALAGTALTPDPSVARPGGIRGGFHGGGFRAPIAMPGHGRAGILRGGARSIVAHGQPQWRLPAGPRLTHDRGLVRTTVKAPFAHLERQHHHRHVHGYRFPFTTYGDAAFVGIPYDPGVVAIPVYAPPSVIDYAEPFPPPPRLSGTIVNPRDENGEACRSERVTVPAIEGEREILVVRC